MSKQTSAQDLCALQMFWAIAGLLDQQTICFAKRGERGNRNEDLQPQPVFDACSLMAPGRQGLVDSGVCLMRHEVSSSLDS